MAKNRHPGLWLRPRISPDAFVAPGAVVVGDVSLAPGASVWYAAVLRGDVASISVGRNSNVQDGCVVHVDHDQPTVIGDHVTIGHSAVVHAAVIEDEVLVGMNATVLSGAVVGRGSIVGAGALVTEGARIPPGSLVLGVPGRVVRQLGPEVAEKNREHALGYTALAKEHQELASSSGDS
jgi:carbonic anhydrase/acetyltransferase-like protein (isoleucine patch superfamily)